MIINTMLIIMYVIIIIIIIISSSSSSIVMCLLLVPREVQGRKAGAVLLPGVRAQVDEDLHIYIYI